MATAIPKTIVTYRLTGDAVSHARTDVETRDVDMTIDEPVARGGTNMGLAPTEVMIAALIGCTNVIGQRVGETHGVHFEDLKIEAAADFDRRGGGIGFEVARFVEDIVGREQGLEDKARRTAFFKNGGGIEKRAAPIRGIGMDATDDPRG